MVELGLELVGQGPLDRDPLEADQLGVVGGVEHREDVALLHQGPFGDELEEDRRPAGGESLAADADGEVLELALDDGPLAALDPAAGREHRLEVGPADAGDRIEVPG